MQRVSYRNLKTQNECRITQGQIPGVPYIWLKFKTEAGLSVELEVTRSELTRLRQLARRAEDTLAAGLPYPVTLRVQKESGRIPRKRLIRPYSLR